MPTPRYFEIPFIDPRLRCWSCNVARAKGDLGLCEGCRDRLLDEDRSEAHG